MSHFIDKLTFFKREREGFSNGHGVMTDESRGWEQAYRSRWQHDKIVRSTHGVNCTGSVSYTHLDVYKRQLFGQCQRHVNFLPLFQRENKAETG